MAESNDQTQDLTTQDSGGAVITERVVQRIVKEPPTGPNATTNVEKPADHYYLAPDGKTKINAWGETKGSDEDKRRMASVGF